MIAYDADNLSNIYLQRFRTYQHCSIQTTMYLYCQQFNDKIIASKLSLRFVDNMTALYEPINYYSNGNNMNFKLFAAC